MMTFTNVKIATSCKTDDVNHYTHKSHPRIKRNTMFNCSGQEDFMTFTASTRTLKHYSMLPLIYIKSTTS